jgi:SAM-dependent methyltransferase
VPNPAAVKSLTDQTIADFGDQWRLYTDNEGYYGSIEILMDTFGPLLPLSDIEGKKIAEIGSGTGRIVSMLLEAGAANVVAVEPSAAFEILKKNTVDFGERVTLFHLRGDEIPADLDLDFVVSIGVIHHIPDPKPVMQAAYAALRPGGRCIIWVYGYEGNAVVVHVIKCMRAITTHMPHWAIAGLAQLCTIAFDVYSMLVRAAPFQLPLKSYIENVIGKFSREKRYLVIYDQLKPAYAKYYRKREACALLENAGFVAVENYHRRQYSWTVTGMRPAQ